MHRDAPYQPVAKRSLCVGPTFQSVFLAAPYGLTGWKACPTYSCHGLLRARRHTRLEIDTESVGDSIDVVEERDDLRGVVDGAIAEAQIAQPVEIRLVHTAGVRVSFTA